MQKMITIFIVTITTLGITGCQTTKWSKENLDRLNPAKLLSADKKSTEGETFEEPERMAAIWTDTTYSEAGKPTVKGFGARIYFYNAEGEPVKADGELVVYGYDDSAEDGRKSADRKFIFRKSEFQQHYSESSLGSSYSVWVPWEKTGGKRKTVALIPKFITASGKSLMGDQSLNVLPGKDSDPETGDEAASEVKITHDTQTAGYQGDNSNKVVQAGAIEEVRSPDRKTTTDNTRRTRSITIPMTRSMSNRLKSLPPQASRRALTTANLAAATANIASAENSKAKAKSQMSKPVESKPVPAEPTTRPVFGMPGATK